MSSSTMTKQLLPSALSDAMVTPPSSVKRSKTKPMIVDITLNDNGEQVYKVQGATTRAASRKRKIQDDENDDEFISNKRMTPIRSILGAISPNTLNQDKVGISSESNNSKLNGSPSIRKPDNSDANIWSNDVEDAFEEALRMIPKNGLAKIKISGKSCGRNELISDYIIQKTGKVRTRKQVSSHIQVIKNLRKNHDLIELINNGPSDSAAIKKFDEVFSEISFKKSLGNAGPSPDISLMKPSTPVSATKRRSSRKSTPRAPQQKSRRTSRNMKDISFSMRSFEMLNIDYEIPRNSHTYTKISSGKMERPLRLKPNASIQNRFPNLKDYLYDTANQDEQIPILHNLVNLRLPHPSKCFNGQHETSLEVDLKNVPNDEDFGCITMIYSFGNEVIKLNDDVLILEESAAEASNELKNFTLQLNFAKDFWVAFFNSLEKNVSEDLIKCENQKTIAVKAITMKQIIFSKKRSSGFDKDDIRSIILWEFTRNEDSFETTSRRLYLPNTERTEIKFLSKLSEPVSALDPQNHDTSDENSSECSVSPHSQLLQLPLQQHQSPNQQQQLHNQHNLQDEYEKDFEAASANTTIQFDDFEQSEIVPITQPPTFRTNSVPVYLPHQHHQQHQLPPQPIQHPHPPVTTHQLRRFQSEPSSFWNLQHSAAASTSPQLSLQSGTTSTISSEGFNTDEFQGFNHTYTNFGPTLNPGYIHFDHKIEPEFSGEIFPTW